MARGQLMLRLTTAMVDTEDTDTARGLLTPRLLPTMAGEAMEVTAMARGPQMLVLTMAMVDTEVTAMARGLLMPTMAVMDMADMDMARGPLMPTMAAMDMAVTAMASNCNVTFILNINWPKKLNRK